MLRAVVILVAIILKRRDRALPIVLAQLLERVTVAAVEPASNPQD